MKTKLILLSCILICLGSTSPKEFEEHDVKEIYAKKSIPSSTAVFLTEDGEIKELTELAENMLVPMEIENGSYKLSLSHKSSNVYEDYFQNIIVQTSFCYEFGIARTAILKVSGTNGIIKTITFTD